MLRYIVIFVALEFVLIIPSYFFYKRILLKRFGKKNIKFRSILLTVFMPIIYTTFFYSICYGIINPIIRSKKFDSNDWINNVNSRYRMVNDLKNNNILLGKTEKEIIGILGSDYKTNCWGQKTLCYATYDPENYAVLDHYELIVFFDKSDRVLRVEYQMI